ncbi:MAG: hypothetical protein JRI43_04415 [Deltaproteobacteria bacterium]|nr:hypothetical protein [Deltaproteobacteria bacterium]
MSGFPYAKIKAYCISLLMFATLSLILGGRSYGYVMPVEQIVDLMTNNFSKFKTLVIYQNTSQAVRADEDAEKIFREEVIIKSPDLIYSKVLDQAVDRAALPDMTYRQLLISKIFIEKERFIPLLLEYSLPENPTGENIVVWFNDYKKQNKGWYPWEIIYSVGDATRETYTIQALHVNVPIDQSLLNPSGIDLASEKTPEFTLDEILDRAPEEIQNKPADEGPADVDEERLKQIIKVFEEKYQ